MVKDEEEDPLFLSEAKTEKVVCHTINVFILQAIIMPSRDIITVNVSNSQLGVLNLGTIQDVELIDARISGLREKNYDEVARAFKEITEAVIAYDGFSKERDRQELVEQISVLAEQASIDRSQRKGGVIKMALGAVAATCATAGSLAEIWSTWGPQIETFLS